MSMSETRNPETCKLRQKKSIIYGKCSWPNLQITIRRVL